MNAYGYTLCLEYSCFRERKIRPGLIMTSDLDLLTKQGIWSIIRYSRNGIVEPGNNSFR